MPPGTKEPIIIEKDGIKEEFDSIRSAVLKRLNPGASKQGHWHKKVENAIKNQTQINGYYIYGVMEKEIISSKQPIDNKPINNKNKLDPEQPYEIAKRAKIFILQIIEICKLHNKKPIFNEINLFKLWDDIEKPCTTRNEYKIFAETIYKLIKENTRYKNPNYKNKTDQFYIFMLPEEFYKTNSETTHFIFIIDTLRHFYVHDEIGKIGDVFEELLGSKSGPQIPDDYQKLQNNVLMKFEKSMDILLSIIKKRK